MARDEARQRVGKRSAFVGESLLLRVRSAEVGRQAWGYVDMAVSLTVCLSESSGGVGPGGSQAMRSHSH